MESIKTLAFILWSYFVKEVINSWACRQKRLDKIGAMNVNMKCHWTKLPRVSQLIITILY